LVGLVLLAGSLAVAIGHVPVGTVIACAIGFVFLEYLVAPWTIEWLVPAQRIEHDGTRYLTDRHVGDVVARRCRDAGVPLARLGIVDDGTPNAFTFGHTRRDARIWVTRGLLERLDDGELDAVVTHEIGHIRHRDFIVMALVSMIPLALYLFARMLLDAASNSDDDEGGEIVVLAVVLFLCWYVSELLVLSLNRAREYAADHWSCQCTGNGDALASALVKIAYGMGEARAAEKQLERAGRDQTKAECRAARRADAVRAMGIFEPRAAEAMSATFANGLDPGRVVAALRWDAVNPWGAMLEKFSTHPLVARRIAALERSGLPGAPQRFGVLRSAAEVSPRDAREIRRRFARELVIATAPWIALSGLIFASAAGSAFWLGAVLVIAGALFFAKQATRYPSGCEPVADLASLLERLDAGPIAGVAVEVRGRVIGRDSPGYVLSPDLVVQDRSGFVTLRYRQPIPFAGARFGLFRVRDFLGREVVARGWYRRSPAPVIELRAVRTLDSARSARCVTWRVKFGVAIAMVVGGLATMAAGMAG
jgi:Zn-dependent protease with chaperone function